MDENPYDILGVARDASAEEVKRAYRKKARENHPDLNPDNPAAEKRMNEINEAYDRITNPEKYRASDARKHGYSAPYAQGYNGYGAGPAGEAGRAGGASGSAGGGYGSDPQGGPQSGYRGAYHENPYTWTTINFDDLFGGGAGGAASAIHPEVNANDSAEVRKAIAQINTQNWASAIDTLQKIPSTGRNGRWYYLFALANNGAGNTVAANDSIRRARQVDPDNGDYVRAQQQFTQKARSYSEQGKERGFTSFGIDQSWFCCCICLAPTCMSYIPRLCYGWGFYG